MNDKQNEWGEDVSKLYEQIAPVAVPSRDEQIATLLTLFPFGPEDVFQAVELASGEGALSFAILDAFPNASVIALDGSELMRQRTTKRLNPFGSRAIVKPFDILDETWLNALDVVDVVVSSLCVHHLDGEGKQRLFDRIYEKLSPRGALLIADLIEPQRPEARTLFADTWDYVTEAQSLSQTGSRKSFEIFLETQWNYYRYPDPYDQPSPLFDQLLWIKEVGFQTVDCFWLQAAHAIYGGYKTNDHLPTNTLPFEATLQSANRALNTISTP